MIVGVIARSFELLQRLEGRFRAAQPALRLSKTHLRRIIMRLMLAGLAEILDGGLVIAVLSQQLRDLESCEAALIRRKPLLNRRVRLKFPVRAEVGIHQPRQDSTVTRFDGGCAFQIFGLPGAPLGLRKLHALA